MLVTDREKRETCSFGIMDLLPTYMAKKTKVEAGEFLGPLNPRKLEYSI